MVWVTLKEKGREPKSYLLQQRWQKQRLEHRHLFRGCSMKFPRETVSNAGAECLSGADTEYLLKTFVRLFKLV